MTSTSRTATTAPSGDISPPTYQWLVDEAIELRPRPDDSFYLTAEPKQYLESEKDLYHTMTPQETRQFRFLHDDQVHEICRTLNTEPGIAAELPKLSALKVAWRQAQQTLNEATATGDKDEIPSTLRRSRNEAGRAYYTTRQSLQDRAEAFFRRRFEKEVHSAIPGQPWGWCRHRWSEDTLSGNEDDRDYDYKTMTSMHGDDYRDETELTQEDGEPRSIPHVSKL